MITRAVRTILAYLGYDIVRAGNRHPPVDEVAHAECEQMIARVRTHTMVEDEGLISLYYQALFCETNGIPGDYVECGVWKGGAIGLMALVHKHRGQFQRTLHLFDAFGEICEPDERVDGERAVREATTWAKNGSAQGRLVPLKGIYDRLGGPGTLEENKKLLEQSIGVDSRNVRYHKGWFQHTIPQDHDQIDSIAILRLDADWYASTKLCLDYLFDKVVPGGFVIIDDYGAYDGCRKATDEFLERKDRPMFLNYVTGDIRYIVIP